VSDTGERLREAFETHETMAPDPGAVYDRVRQLSRKYKRRRRGAQAAGTAVLGAGLVAGAIQLPGLLPGNGQSFEMVAPAGPAPAVPPSVPPSSAPSDEELQRRWDAYFQAGYDYDDALRLAVLWNMTDEPGSIKAEAGRRLLAGETLPIRATPQESEPGAVPPAQIEASARFFAAGYVYEDAVRLAELWKLDDSWDAKVRAGEWLEDGRRLPFKPQPENVAAAKETKQVEKFFAEGYDVDDAVELAGIWKLDTAYDAKVEGGKRLLAGDELPIRP
jgi:hypothetical protein